jgi:AAA+ ATPase superfamily predicted ATPase
LADQSTADIQRLSLAERLAAAFPQSLAPYEFSASWNALLRYFGRAARSRAEKSVLVLDEFPYLVDQTPGLPSHIQAWWDEEGIHQNVLVILCGSHLSTMSALSHPSAPLHGRFNAGRLHLRPMEYRDIGAFYPPRYSIRDKLLMYGVLGGSPRYHALADPNLTWDEQIVDLLLRPGAPFESEASHLLVSENIRDPAPYDAILRAIAAGNTRNVEIQNHSGLSATALTHPLAVLQTLEWITKERSFGESSDRRTLYRICDPFISFWFRFGAPLASALRFQEPMAVFRSRIEPHLSDYMGRFVFEGVCAQWLRREGHARLGLQIEDISRYWSRDGQVEIDLVAELTHGGLLFGECKWSAGRPLKADVYGALVAKVHGLPETRWRSNARYVLFSLGGYTDELRKLAEVSESLHLVEPEWLFSSQCEA